MLDIEHKMIINLVLSRKQDLKNIMPNWGFAVFVWLVWESFSNPPSWAWKKLCKRSGCSCWMYNSRVRFCSWIDRWEDMRSGPRRATAACSTTRPTTMTRGDSGETKGNFTFKLIFGVTKLAKNLDPGLKYFSLVTFGYVWSVGHGLEFALSKKFCQYKIEIGFRCCKR